MFKRILAAAGAVALLGGVGVLATAGVASAAPTPPGVVSVGSAADGWSGFISGSNLLTNDVVAPGTTFVNFDAAIVDTNISDIPSNGTESVTVGINNGAAVWETPTEAGNSGCAAAGPAGSVTCTNNVDDFGPPPGSPGGSKGYEFTLVIPHNAAPGSTFTVTVNVSDKNGAASATFTLTIDQVTLIAPTAVTVYGGVAATITDTATTLSGTPLVFSYTGLPSFLTQTGTTGVVTGTAPTSDIGDTYTYNVKVCDGLNVCAYGKTAVTVATAPPTPAPSQSSSSTSTSTSSGTSGTTPSGGVETGGGIAPSSPLLPVGVSLLALAGLGVLAVGYRNKLAAARG